MLTDEQKVPVGSANAILDTNVALAIYSWHDVLKVGDEVLRADPGETLEHGDIQFRAQRQRVALQLALFFNEHSWKVAVPVQEFLRILRRNAPPTDPATSNFTRLQLHFIRGTLMPNWTLCGDEKSDAGVTGSDVDRLCMDWAVEHEIPLISWEGWGPEGLNEKTLIQREAPGRGIDLLSPEQLLKRLNFDGASAVRRFLADWDARIGEYAAKTEGAAAFLEYARPYYQRLADDDWTR
jgi:hypothetical protein